MAEVFRAVSHGVEGWERVFVVKRILREKSAAPEFIEMFVNEARISALLNHPNIVQIYDFGMENGSYFLSMEFVHGKDLLAVLRQLRAADRVMDPANAASIAHQVAAGLHHAHTLTQGGKHLQIVHRDVSPSNVMLLREGGVKLLDFGIAKAVTEVRRQGSGTTQHGLVKGKLSYLSPEQVRGENVDGRSDVFSLGVVLWECLTGRRLFYDKTEFDTMRNVIERPIPPPSTQRSGIPPALDIIVVRALERDLERRYPNAKVMVDDLENFLREARHVPSALPHLLDELFGTDAADAGSGLPARGPDAPTVETPAVSAELAREPAGAHLSASVPPLSVGRTGAGTPRPDGVLASAPHPRRRRSIIAIGASAVALGALFAVVGTTGTKTRAGATPSGAIAIERAPAGPRHTPAPATATAPTAAPTPTVPTVTLKIDSEPMGAAVSDERGEILGHTPATIALQRQDRSIALSVTLPGFEVGHHSVVPDRDLSAMITLQAKGDSVAARPHIGANTHGPARIRQSLAAASPTHQEAVPGGQSPPAADTTLAATVETEVPPPREPKATEPATEPAATNEPKPATPKPDEPAPVAP